VGGEAFAVFDVENDVDGAVLVQISLREAERLIRRGADDVQSLIDKSKPLRSYRGFILYGFL